MREIKLRYRISHYKTPNEIIIFVGTISDIENRKWTPNPFDLAYRILSRSQFTGLVDCVGHDIYEDDVVNFGEYTDGSGPCNHIVKWSDKRAMFITLEIASGEDSGSLDPSCKVIGTIYENPKLINL